jgi:serpin B
MARTDSLGRYSLDGIDPGQVRIFVRAIGFTRADSTITFRGGDSLHWDVTLRVDPALREFRRQLGIADSQNSTAGRVDSIALRLIGPTTDRALPLGAFGSRLFATIVAQRGADSNTVISPLSAGMALSLVRFGARGATAAALDQVLAMRDIDQATVEQRGAQMMSDLLRRTDVTLEMANAIWVDTRVTPTPSFSASTTRWSAKTASIPLATAEAMDAINHWADSVTHKKIKTILSEPLDQSARLLIANAVYFKGKWLDSFEKSATQSGDFTLPSGKRITVPRMTRVANVGYRRASGFQTIRLPYRTGKTAMYIVLPDAGVSFDAVVRRLNAGDWAPSAPLTDARRVHVVFPRFHAELTIELKDPLVKLGAEIAFDCERADFGAMVLLAPSLKRPGLCISGARQKVYIDVDEEGTEAAAVTAFDVVLSSAPPPPIEFVVDRPFLFVLRDETTGADLFVGRIAHP